MKDGHLQGVREMASELGFARIGVESAISADSGTLCDKCLNGEEVFDP
jgi:hypothetical protein